MTGATRWIVSGALGSIAVAAIGGALWGGTPAATSSTVGAVGATILQLLALRAYARAFGSSGQSGAEARSVVEASERAVRALGAAAAIRLFGGVLVIVAATRVEALSLWPFVSGFAFGYFVLEIAVGRWLIAQERRG